MKTNESINIPRKGMNTDVHPSQLAETDYIHALNATIEDYTGSYTMMGNEPSNILCVRFKEGYKVVGFKTSLVEDRVYFLLGNSTNNRSEIGYIQGTPSITNSQDLEVSCGCDIIKILDTPLEEVETFMETCSYVRLTGDNCLDENGEFVQEEPCLNFNVNNPIREGNIVIKVEKTGNKMYWTNGDGSQMVLDFFKLENGYYNTTGITVCDVEYNVEDVCIDCEKLKLFKMFDKPCIEPEQLITGGSLRMGIYQFLIAYSDVNGNELSSYYSMTNPISIFDHNRTSLSPAELADRTNLGIKLKIENLDTSYPYYKIVVIQRNDVQFTESYIVEGVHPVSETTVLYDREYLDNERTTLPHIMSLKPIYESANMLTSAGGYLIQGGMTTHPEINLQPVVSLMGGFVNWKTGKAKESLYRDGVNTSLYQGYTRDEVQPFGFRVYTDKGFVSPIFPFIPRPATEYEKQTYTKSSTNYKSLLRFVPECSEYGRDKVWQFENTATVEGYSTCSENTCVEESENCELVTQEISKSCIENVYQLSSNAEEPLISWTFEPRGTYRGLLNEISRNPLIIQDNNPALYTLMQGGFPDEHCTPSFNLQEGDVCTEPVLVGTPKIFVSEINEVGEPVFTPKELSDYELLQDEEIEETNEDYEEIVCTKITLNNGSPIRGVSLANLLAQRIGIDDQSRFNSFDYDLYSRNSYDYTTSSKPCIKNIKISQGNDIGREVNNRADVYAGWEIWFPCQGTGTCGNPLWYALNTGWNKDALLSLDEHILPTPDQPCNPLGIIGCEPYYIAHVDYNLDKAFSNYSSLIDFVEPVNFGLYSSPSYNKKIASNATWIKIDKRTDGKTILLDLSRSEEAFEDVVTAKEIRLSFFKSCSELTSFKSELIDARVGEVMQIPLSMFENPLTPGQYLDSIYLAVDTILTGIYSSDNPVDNENKTTGWKYKAVGFINKYIDGCFKITYREEEFSEITVNFNKLLVDKKETYKLSCDFFQKTNSSCGVVLDKFGDFGYYESIKEYPDNKELYDSSNLVIKKDSVPESFREKFEDYYVDKAINLTDTYKLDYDQTNFRCKPIRHFRFPSNSLVPYISTRPTESNEEVDIYPLGVHIDNEVIETFLQVAVDNNLITQAFKDSIIGYDILRGDKTLDKSVIARGILFDVYEYREGNKKALYSNYPYNDLGDDILNMSDVNRYAPIQHPYNGNGNNRFTFHSPDTHFNPPTTLPTEMSLDGYIFGKSKGVFSEVTDHPKWIILGDRAYSVAKTLATAECVFEALIGAAEASSRAQVFGGLVVGLGIPSFVAAGVILATGAISAVMFKFARYRNQWLETFQNLGTPKNFANYYTSVGRYNYFSAHEDNSKNNSVRGIAFSRFMRQGNHNVVEKFGNSGGTNVDYMFNNTDREFTYYLSLGKNFNLNYDDAYKTYDNNRVDNTLSSKTFASASSGCGGANYLAVSNEITRNIASPYVTLKSFKISQYGSLNSIRWINTNYCGTLYDHEIDEVENKITKKTLDNRCDIVFGGDTFISRFSFKRKFPFFYVNAMNESDLLPFNYAAYRNVGYPKFYVDYGVDDSISLGSISMPSMLNDFNLDCLYGKNTFYVRPPSKFYLFYYGIPQFLVESEINCNFRYAGDQLHQEFYPQTGNYVDWTQEKNVSIKTPEEFRYNDVYSSRAILSGNQLNRVLPIDFDKAYADKANNLESVVIYSEPDASEIEKIDPWAIYKPNNKHQFPTAYGKLIDIRGIESEQILVRFENTVEVHNPVNQYKDAVNPSTAKTGTGTLFSSRPNTFNSTDLGYGGTQHKALVSTEFGHFWADSMRGQVFSVDPNGRNLTEITAGKKSWFKEHLPFKIIKSVKGMTVTDTDNNFKGLGLTFGYDSRFKRIFLTKKDYVAKNKDIYYEKGNFYLGEDDDKIELSLTDDVYFEDVSFTMAYSPATKSWISYYSFKPDYYISYNNYFQTGLNFSKSSKELGLWSHLLTNKSYQVFYGKKYPWTIELPFKNNMVNKVLESVSYWLDSRRYHNDYDFAEKRNEGFNRAWIYNNSNNSGRLDLVLDKKNDMFQKTQYPKFKGFSNEILVTENDKRWSFNYFYNEVRNELNNNPIWLWDKNSIDKVINMDALKYNNPWKDRLRGDWFNVILSQDKETRFKYIFKWINAKENMYRN